MSAVLEWAASADARRVASREARWAAARLGASIDAADVEQEILLALVRGAARYDVRRGSLQAWGGSVARSCARQLVERQAARKRSFVVDERQVDDCHSPDAGQLDRLVEVKRALDELPPQMRRLCIELMHHSVAESARRLRISRTTVYTHRAKVRRHFAARGLGAYLGLQGAA